MKSKQTLKVGQKYRVIKDLIPNREYGGLCFVEEMTPYLGKIIEFVNIDSDGYGYIKDGWFFSKEMLH